MRKPIDDYCVPITSGLTPAATGGTLTPERAAALHRSLDELAAARQRAWAESRNYPVEGRVIPEVSRG